MKKKQKYLSLQAGFQSVANKAHNVASAIFPIMITEKNDLHITFFNYWTKKNLIKVDNLRISMKLYGTSGDMLLHVENKISKFHNQFSIKKILQSNRINTNNINGMVNVEVISLEKISFPFPAITGIYQADNLLSAVHSPGRLKNNAEIQEVFYTEETNWSCKFDKSITPFFHYFIGNKRPSKKYILIKILSSNNKLKKIKKIFIDKLSPFSSKLFYIKDIFKNTKFDNSDFISVTVENNSIFPRMIVGNFHIKKKFYELTHSFPRVTFKDYCPKIKKNYFESKILGHTNKDLNLKLKIFPTSCKGEFKAVTFVKNHNKKKLVTDNKTTFFSDKELSKTILIPFDKNEEIKSIKLKGSRIPSRLNTSYIYKVEGAKNNYSLDIAHGGKSGIYPDKFNHWGCAYLADGYKSVILISNDNYNFNNDKEIKGTLNLYSQNFHEKINVKIHPASGLIVDLSNLKNLKKLKNHKLKFATWFLELRKPGCECFWLSYRKKDGSIFGDHSF